MDVLYKMQSMSDTFSVSERKVYELLISNPGMVKQYTITSLAEIAGTSTTAVLRFCKALGYNGYKDFRYDMVRCLDEGIRQPLAEGDLVNRALDVYGRAMQALLMVERPTIQAMADDIIGASVVYSFGAYRSSLPAKMLEYDLEDCGITTLAERDSVAFKHHALAMPRSSVMVLFSVSGHPHFFRDTLEISQPRHPKVWLVTCNEGAGLAKMVDHVITLPRTNIDPGTTFDEQPIVMTFVELLALTVRERLAAQEVRQNEAL